MTDIYLADPNSKYWPDIFGNKQPSRIAIEESSSVKSLISSGLLLTKEFNLLLSQVQILSAENDILLKGTKNAARDPDYSKKLTALTIKIIRAKSVKPGDIGKEIDAAVHQASIELRQEENLQLRKRVQENSEKIEDLFNKFVIAHVGSEIKILSDVSLYFCGQCHGLFTTGTFLQNTCMCGKQIQNIAETEKVAIKTIEASVNSFMKLNMWLEYGVDLLFRKGNYATGCGVFILGHSGVRHEVDLIVEKQKKHVRATVECKNQEINLDEVFKLYAKMSDIGCNKGYIFTTSLNRNNDVIKYAMSKNIIVVEEVLEKKESELRKFIRD